MTSTRHWWLALCLIVGLAGFLSADVETSDNQRCGNGNNQQPNASCPLDACRAAFDDDGNIISYKHYVNPDDSFAVCVAGVPNSQCTSYSAMPCHACAFQLYKDSQCQIPADVAVRRECPAGCDPCLVAEG
jgi:hypothetical protein